MDTTLRERAFIIAVCEEARKLIPDDQPVMPGLDGNLPADKNALRKLGEAAMDTAARNGRAKLADGVFIYADSAMIERQKEQPAYDLGENIDYTAAPFWVIVAGETSITATPCNDPIEVMDVAGFLDRVKEPVTAPYGGDNNLT